MRRQASLPRFINRIVFLITGIQPSVQAEVQYAALRMASIGQTAVRCFTYRRQKGIVKVQVQDQQLGNFNNAIEYFRYICTPRAVILFRKRGANHRAHSNAFRDISATRF
ncbi:hypothetical protein SISSUDRAFT_1049055 [Sistotremastrum suecicum HHB10207 ss-3]|uniref:Uncharacterized protein n=1 Tax=Sistotremastrum suecicum HHB10207 ss-3 TaxID=1314776 RepID=A0A166C3E8_9AGAM|nr:hypothetical protein SISSUDRAFT_1049055 [Sistotremastrum suecicum HHB10207 ss-3]